MFGNGERDASPGEKWNDMGNKWWLEGGQKQPLILQQFTMINELNFEMNQSNLTSRLYRMQPGPWALALCTFPMTLPHGSPCWDLTFPSALR